MCYNQYIKMLLEGASDMDKKNTDNDEIVFDESVCSAEFAEGCTETVADQEE